jgi:hypothetical protein
MALGDFLSGYYNVKPQLPEYIFRKAEAFFSLDRLEKESLDTVEKLEERKKRLRAAFIDAIGGLDIKKTPLEAVCTGNILRDGYSVKKSFFKASRAYTSLQTCICRRSFRAGRRPCSWPADIMKRENPRRNTRRYASTWLKTALSS